MDKGTAIRTTVLFVTIINQIFGVGSIALDEGQVITMVEGIYLFVSILATAASAIWAWYKNNYITSVGKKQKEVLVKEGLAKK